MNADDQSQVQNALRHGRDRRSSVLMNEILEESRVNILQCWKRLLAKDRRRKSSLSAVRFVRRNVDDDGQRRSRTRRNAALGLVARRLDGRTLRTRTFDLFALLRISPVVNVNDQRTGIAQRLEKPRVVRVGRRGRRANLHVEIVDANVDFRPTDAKTSQSLQRNLPLKKTNEGELTSSIFAKIFVRCEYQSAVP